MKIEGTRFGSITIGGTIYDHDVLIRLSGEVRRRKKNLSKKEYGTSHIISKQEARFVYELGCTELIIGTGQFGNVRLSPEAEIYFKKRGCRIIAEATPGAIKRFNESREHKIALFHVTC
jgi:hypothetical protein